jgi:pimeloyl-ACP methyl ester carboxylesterase
MGPSSSDPKDLRMILNPARRRALTILIGSIISQMRSKIEYSFVPSLQSPSAEDTPPLFVSRNSGDESTSASSPDPKAEQRQQQLGARVEKNIPRRKMQELEVAALKYFDGWQDEVVTGLGKIVNAPEDPRSEQRRREWLATRSQPRPPPPYTPTATEVRDPDAVAAAEARELQEAKDITLLQNMYPPISTRLTTISKEDRISVLSCMVLILLGLGHYSAHSRVLLCNLASSFALPLSILTTEETEIARTLIIASKTLTADAETQKRAEENASARRWKVGLASVAGAALIGVTGGIATPIVAGAIGGLMGTVGLGGVASFLGIFAMKGALVGSLFGAYGAKMTGTMVDNYAKEVSDFKFLPIKEEWGEFGTREEEEVEGRRLRVTIGINGWLNSKEDARKSWRVLGQDSGSEVFALRYEVEALLQLGNSLQSMVSSYAWSFVKLEILKRTVLATLWSALWPVYLLKMATSIDNPFNMARNRSDKAGEVLADALINKAQGERPVTLVGYSLGSRVIYSCLTSLAERKAFGLVESVVLIGSPIPSNSSNWRMMRSVVSGKVINVYSENDYILAFLYRATSIQLGVAGLQAISDVDGVENMNLTKEVSGHLRYPDLIGKILKRLGFEGIMVEDTHIEEETRAEIQLVELDAGMDADAHPLSEAGFANLMDQDPADRMTRTVSSARSPSLKESGPGDRSISTLSNTRSDLLPAAPVDETAAILSRTGIASLMDDPLDVDSSTTPAPASIPSRPAATTARDEESESDDGGIQMVDNDSDGGLMRLPHVPEPEPDEPHDRESTRITVREEQKVLGSFPRGKEVTASEMLC